MGIPKEADMPTLFEPEAVLEPQMVPMELNLEGWPLFSRQRSCGDGILEVRDTISTEDGQRVEQLWRATAARDSSLPGTFDEDVFVGVMALVKKRGGMPEDGQVRFSTYELVNVLGKGTSARTYRQVRESLDRIGSTVYYSENAFYVYEDQSLESYRFTLWAIHFSRANRGDGRSAEHHTLTFDNIIVRSYNSGYLKLLDTDLYLRLKLPLAKGLYRLVDQRRGESLNWSVDVSVLRDLLGMSQSYKSSSKIWQVLNRAHHVLKQKGYLKSARLNGQVACYRVHENHARDRQSLEATSSPSLRDQAIAALLEVQVWPNRARALVDQFGPEKAFHALEVLKLRGEVGNPGAYVAKVVQRGEDEELRELAQLLAAQTSALPGQEKDFKGKGTGTKDGSSQAHGNVDEPLPAPDPDLEALGVWEGALEGAGEEINAPSLKIWFEGTVPTCLREGLLHLSAPNAFAREYIESRFKEMLERRLSEQLHEETSIVVSSREE